jgi:protein-tyrosine phosphatase
MRKHLFGPASQEEQIVFGARRPGYHSSPPVLGEDIREWITFMQAQGIKRVCCLLSSAQLRYYTDDLLVTYQAAFGQANVCWAPVEDFHLCEAQRLTEDILPFLRASDAMQTPVVVHCSGGSGRTGHVLTAWLVNARQFSIEQAIEAVRAGWRNPCEAIEAGNATWEDLRALLKASAQSESI